MKKLAVRRRFPNSMSLAFEQHLPGGMIENSPAFQRWGPQPRDTTPEGTAEVACLSRPSGTYREIEPHPALKRWAILRCPFGTRTKRGFLSGDLNPNPSGINDAESNSNQGHNTGACA